MKLTERQIKAAFVLWSRMQWDTWKIAQDLEVSEADIWNNLTEIRGGKPSIRIVTLED